MSRGLKLLLVVAAAAFGFAALSWPRINDVETGRTPEYPDLQAREYAAGPREVAKAAKDAIARLPRWTLVGAGQGPGGGSLQAVAKSRVWSFEDDVTVTIRRDRGKTRVSVRSKSRTGSWDFGQNARNIRAFLAELDRGVR
jgi:uncharacterized protein (DUF1499 family)